MGKKKEMRQITMDEVKQHRHVNDCWIVVSGKVYDVTSFVDDHPGGGEIIVDVSGGDATSDFDDVGHSDMARAEMEDLQVGVLVAGSAGGSSGNVSGGDVELGEVNNASGGGGEGGGGRGSSEGGYEEESMTVMKIDRKPVMNEKTSSQVQMIPPAPTTATITAVVVDGMNGKVTPSSSTGSTQSAKVDVSEKKGDMQKKEIEKSDESTGNAFDRFCAKIDKYTFKNYYFIYIFSSLCIVLFTWLNAKGGIVYIADRKEWRSGIGSLIQTKPYDVVPSLDRIAEGKFKIVGFEVGVTAGNVTGYAYKLKDPTILSLTLPWVFYWLHQIPQWYLIWRAQSEKPKYSDDFRWFNWAMLKLNVVFLVIKYVQTNLTYDGISASMPLAWGTGTVGVMLFLVLAMEVPRRGIAGGKGGRFRITKECGKFIRKYHAYYISFALINDFWYHPFEATPGHLFGILNDCLLLWQTVSIYHRSHRNAYWNLCLEVLVLPHSAVIAINRGRWSCAPENPLASTLSSCPMSVSGMFGFGYFFVLIVTQMHGLPKMKKWQKGLLIFAFFASLFLSYGLEGRLTTSQLFNETLANGTLLQEARTVFYPRGLLDIVLETTRIPMLDYGSLLFYLFFYFVFSSIYYKCMKNSSPTAKKVFAVSTSVFVCAFSFVPFFLLFGFN